MSFIPAALLGGALGLFPSSLMLLASFLPICVDMSPLAEASIQNIAAGLIIGAVGMEFFPVIKQSTDEGNIVAVTAGFVVSLLVLLGVERLVSFVSAFPSTAPQQEEAALSETTPLTSGWEAEGIDYASTALTNSCHQQNIRERLCSIQQHVDAVTSRCREFLEDSSPLPIAASELAFEHIDEALHTLHYKIDHAVRLLQGSEYANLMTAASSRHIIQAPSMHRLKPGFKDHGEVQNICNDLQAAAKHIVGHATKSVSSTDLLEVFDHLEELKSAVVNLHGHVESASRKWCRSKPFPNTAPGDFVSIGLTMPVCIDSIVDGFVIGIAASTSVNAGVIMALVNSMEMSFLAIAYSPRSFKIHFYAHFTFLSFVFMLIEFLNALDQAGL